MKRVNYSLMNFLNAINTITTNHSLFRKIPIDKLHIQVSMKLFLHRLKISDEIWLKIQIQTLPKMTYINWNENLFTVKVGLTSTLIVLRITLRKENWNYTREILDIMLQRSQILKLRSFHYQLDILTNQYQ